MLFLLNDVVLEIAGIRLPSKLRPRQLAALPFYSVARLGQELFAEDPLLPSVRPVRAQRLAALIASKAPAINAALFVAPAFDGPVEAVQARFASVERGLMQELQERQAHGRLDLVFADRRVWRRLAA